MEKNGQMHTRGVFGSPGSGLCASFAHVHVILHILVVRLVVAVVVAEVS